MSVLVFADIQNGKLNEATARTLTAAKALGEAVHVLVVGQNIGAVAAAAAKLDGVEKILAVDDVIYAHQLAEPLAALIVALAADYSAILSASTSTAKNAMPRVAALLDVMQISEIIKVVAPDSFERPIYAGNAIQTVQSSDAKKIITVRTAAFPAAGEGAAAAPIEAVGAAVSPDVSRFKDESVVKSDRPELSSAKVIISGGRGMQNAENFSLLIQPVADKLGAAMGASRAAVDAGYAPNDWQVGQTGKIVAPDLYIAVGISGAIQHLAGMKDSKVIVAINKDADAPIFEIADYGLIGDLFTVLPALNEALAKLGR